VVAFVIVPEKAPTNVVAVTVLNVTSDVVPKPNAVAAPAAVVDPVPPKAIAKIPEEIFEAFEP
jgi:hypothetical protein